MSFRILFIDDDPSIRDIVELSLGLDPDFIVTVCTNGIDALAIAPDLQPDLILCDLMMPVVDGTTVLRRLREGMRTANTPVIFLTARAESSSIERLKALGAFAVITKPFDPMTLAETLRSYLRSIKFETAAYDFDRRLHTDAATLSAFREKLRDNSDSSAILEGFLSCVHKLAGAAGIFNFPGVSRAASILEEAIIERLAGRGFPGRMEATLDSLLQRMERG